MSVGRYIITDRQWAKIEPHCLGKKSDPCRRSTHQLTLNLNRT